MRYLMLLLSWPCLVMGQTYAGTLQSLPSPALQIAEQNITISINNIKVTYVYNNTSDEGITDTLVFSIPLSNNENHKQPVILVNQQPVTTQIMQQAISSSGYDVTKELKVLGLPFNPIAAIHSIDASTNRDSLIARLRALKILDQHEDTPTWSVKTFYYWPQYFPPHSTTTIEQIYKPTVSTQTVKLKHLSSLLKIPAQLAKKVWNLAIHWTLQENSATTNLKEQFEKYWPRIQDYCVTQADYQHLFNVYQQKNSGKQQIELKELSFAATSQDMWAHSIGRFSLNIESNKHMYPILCWQAELKRLPNQNLQFNADNFVPLQDIKILYVEN